MVVDFLEKLEMYLDILGESPEGGALNPLEPYTLQLTPAEKKLVIDSVEMIEELAYRGEQLANKFKTFIRSNAEKVISYHHELLYFQSLLEMKKAIQLAKTARNDLDELNESKHAKINFVNETPSLSQAQWVLVFYYFFKQNGLEPRVGINISPLARFIHLATGIKYSTVQNSDIYDKLSKAPNFKADKELLKDLEKIRPIFENHGFNEILQMIDKEIDMCKKK